MNKAGQTNTAGEKLRIDANIRTRVHHDSACKQNLSQELPLCTIFRRGTAGRTVTR